jgi:hypothetical protein
MVHAVDFERARLGGLIGRVYPRKHRTGLPDHLPFSGNNYVGFLSAKGGDSCRRG